MKVYLVYGAETNNDPCSEVYAVYATLKEAQAYIESNERAERFHINAMTVGKPESWEWPDR